MSKGKIKTKTSWRVPILKSKGHFVTWPGDGPIRYFSVDSLPECLKLPLAILMNSPRAAELDNVENIGANILDIPEGCDAEFGWQYSKNYYIIVVTDKELELIKNANAEEITTSS